MLQVVMGDEMACSQIRIHSMLRRTPAVGQLVGWDTSDKGGRIEIGTQDFPLVVFFTTIVIRLLFTFLFVL